MLVSGSVKVKGEGDQGGEGNEDRVGGGKREVPRRRRRAIGRGKGKDSGDKAWEWEGGTISHLD